MPNDTTAVQQAERAILSAILNYSHAMEIASESIRPEHFTDPTNRAIYEACCDLQVQEIAIDLVGVNDVLETKGKSLSAHLAELLTEVGTSAMLTRHMEILVDHHIRRQVLNLTKDLSGYDSGYAMLAEVQRRMAEIEAQAMTESGNEPLFTAESIAECLERLRNKPEVTLGNRIYPSGVDELDKVIGGFGVGTVTAIQAMFKSGKTKFLLQVLCQCARSGVPIGFLSLDMAEWRIRNWVLSHTGRIDSKFFKSPFAKEWEDRRAEYIAYIESRSNALCGLPLFVNDIRRPSIDQVAAIVAQWARNGVKLIGLDFLERMQMPEDWNREGVITSRLADIAKRNDVAFIYIDQQNKSGEHSPGATVKDSRGSVSRCADADTLLIMKNTSSRKRENELPEKMAEIEMLIIERDGVSGRRIKLMADLSIGWFAGKAAEGM